MTMSNKKCELIDIANGGASFILDASKYTKYDLVDIAKAIQEGCTLQLFSCNSKTKYELIDIVKAAPRKVILQYDDTVKLKN
ncbi:hypothetical protein E4O04_00905 [Treponema sp. OMZ 799]|uniref:hypothetical protein n=1 Tax=Treponema sp. OMZ 799 TaxID=2563668 RepID=UPI0020A3E909|nr:hypothetical protein [Treponema sp. OMZ 799]UTC76657.1 hypothetical protein E4O04_00905 [Treponema sp. OMZ 799]